MRKRNSFTKAINDFMQLATLVSIILAKIISHMGLLCKAVLKRVQAGLQASFFPASVH